MGNTVIQTLLNWKDVHDWFASICFDTTSSNPGVHTGAITVIWQVHHKHVLFLACRHHILEIISATVLKQFSIFSWFKDRWIFIGTNKFRPINALAIEVESELTGDESNWLNLKRSEIIGFLHNQLTGDNQPCQDYQEFIILTLITLGANDSIVGNDEDGKIHLGLPRTYYWCLMDDQGNILS